MNKTYVVVIIILTLLSLGPISYFFSGTPKIPVDKDSNFNQHVIKTLEGDVPGNIVDILPFISYVGESSVNDKDSVQKVVYVLGNENSTVKVSLGNTGYRYEIFVPLMNITDSEEVGSYLFTELGSFFITSL